MDSLTIKLFLHFLFHLQRVSPSQDLFSKNHSLFESDVDVDILEKFFVDFRKAYLRKHDPKYITIIGATNDELKQVVPVFEGFPYIVCSGMERCGCQKEFGRGSFLILFLDDTSEETLGKRNDTLSRCRECKVLFIADGPGGIDDILSIFTLATQQHVQYIEFAHLEDNAMKLYSYFIATNCYVQVRLVHVWRPGAGLDNIHHWSFRLKDLKGCPISVSSLTLKPKMMIEETENGTLTIAGGRDGKMLLAIAERLNFTIALRKPTAENRTQQSKKMSVVNDVVNGAAEIGIARIRPTNELLQVLKFSVAYDEECVTWGVPRVIHWPYSIVWVEFSWEVWAFVGVVFSVTCAIEYTHQRTSLTKNGKGVSRGFVAIVLDMIAVYLGNPVTHVSSSRAGKFMLMVSLYYVLVVTTAYKTSLGAILATNEGTPTIVNVDGILGANLTPGGSMYHYNILNDQVNDSDANSKLLDRFVVIDNDTENFHRLMFHHDFAFLARRSSLNYKNMEMVSGQEPLTFYTLSDCVLTYPVVMTFQKKSSLRKPASRIIQRLAESGILEYWDLDRIDNEKILGHKSGKKYFDDRAFNNFRTIFILYSGCIAFCFVTFLIELLVPRFDSARKRFYQ